MRFPRVIPEYTKFQGGLDLETPALSINPGGMISGQNYVADVMGGYSRIDGFERYDGRTSPSSGSYHYIAVDLTGTVALGDVVEGDTSAATGYVIVVETAVLYVVVTSGTFVDGEDILVGVAVVGSITSEPLENSAPTGMEHATALNLAADYYRALISGPNNAKPILGVAERNGTLYCWQDNDAGTACVMYEATASGWSEIDLYHEISFNTGLAEIADDTAISQTVSGATAVCKRTILESGTFEGGNAVGRLIITTIVGTFNATGEIQVSAATKMTATSLATQISLSPSGRYETVVHNFYGATGSKRLYGCDGVSRGFEFDGDVFAPIKTGMTTDKPEHVYAHKKQLFFSFGSSSQNSGIGRPQEWTAVTGAAEIAIGDDITGYLQMAGDALAIISKGRIDQLLGTDVDDFTLSTVANDVGGIEWTLQRLEYAFCLDNRGVTIVTPTDKYGNFEQKTVSRHIHSLIETIRTKAVASVAYKTKKQYRIYCNDGTGLCMTLMDESLAFTFFKYPVNVTCAVSGEDSSGNEVIFLGTDSGMVYQADKGSSFDGEDIEAYFITPFNHSKGPTTLKSYKKATVEITSEGYSEVRFHPDFSYGSSDYATHFLKTVTLQGTGGMWNVDDWESFFYDAPTVENPSFTIDGNGTNMALVIYSKSQTDQGHKIDGAVVHYIRRKIVP